MPRLVRFAVAALLSTTTCASISFGAEVSRSERVDKVFAQWDTTNSPGCALSVIQNGRILYKRGYGMASLDYDVPIRTDTIFHVASVSKEFTAASIALLSLEGKLSLDDPIQKYLTWMPDFGEKITIRNLVHHNSGIRDQWSLLNMSGWRYSRDRITDEDVIYLLKRQRDLNFSPGEQYLYSNSGYTLLGLIVHKVSGLTLREFTTERIFKPLGMSRTHFRDDFSEIVKDQALGYSWDSEQNAFKLSVTNFDTVGATSLLTTVEDMALWDRNFIDPVVGGPEFLELMHHRGKLNNGEDQDYAFGLAIGTYRGLRTVGHGGSDAGYRSHFLRFPEQGYSFVTLCNLAQTNPGRLARDVADIYLEDQLKPVVGEAIDTTKAVPLSEAEITRLEGVFWSDDLALVLQTERKDGVLKLNVGTNRTLDMVHGGQGLFRVPEMGVLVRFEPSEGAVKTMTFWPPDEPQDKQSAQRTPPFEITETRLQEFAGSYNSPELPVTYHIVLDQGQLTLEWLKGRPAELKPIAKDLLVGGAGSLRFQRNEQGSITGFVLDSGRVRNFKFTRVP